MNPPDLAAGDGQLSVIESLYKQGAKFSQKAADFAAMMGHMDIVEFLWDHGIHVTPNGVDFAAINGHLPVVKFLHNKDLYPSQEGINCAVRYGRLSIIKFCYDNGIRPNRLEWATSYRAIDHSDILDFLKSKEPQDGLEKPEEPKQDYKCSDVCVNITLSEFLSNKEKPMIPI